MPYSNIAIWASKELYRLDILISDRKKHFDMILFTKFKKKMKVIFYLCILRQFPLKNAEAPGGV